MVACNMLWGPATVGFSRNEKTSAAFSAFGLSDGNSSSAQILNIPKDGVVSHVGIGIIALTGSPPAYNVAVVTVGANGNPTTTPAGGSAVVSYSPVGTGFVWVPLATQATLAAGDVVAVRIWPGVTPPDGGNNIAVGNELWLTETEPKGCGRYAQTSDGSNWGTYGGWSPSYALRYTTGEVIGIPCTGWDPDNILSTDTPDEVGNVFILPFDAVCIGARIAFTSVGADASYTTHLYDSLDAELASLAVTDEDLFAGRYMKDMYWDPVSLAAGTYRLVNEATDAANRICQLCFAFESQASREDCLTLPEANAWQKTERTDSGAWTDTPANLVYMALWLSDISTGAGGGGMARWV